MTRVLVVDDEPQILRALRINLHARQYDVVTAGTGRGALDAAADAHPDLVILDLGLPDMDGVDVIRSLRKWTHVPIVILSGRMNSAAKVNALDAGADDYVTKPFSVEELLARIRAVTRRTTEPEPVEPVQVGRWTVDLSDHSIYETLEGHVEKGISTFTIEKLEDKLIFKIQTFSAPGNFLTKLLGPVFSVPYQSYCTGNALENVERQID